MTTLMWEVRAAPGRLDELLDHVLTHAGPAAQVYRSESRVVVIDPAGQGLPDPPAELLARPPHRWTFEQVTRPAGQ